MGEKYRFVVRFALLIVALYVAVAVNVVNDRVVVPYTRALTRSVAAVMRLGGSGVTAHDTVIASSQFAIEVQNGCNGIEAAVLLVAAIGAFRSSAASRLLGIASGLFFIEAVNVIRLILLFWIGEHFRTSFETFHLLVWQVVVIMSAVLFFLAWSSRVLRQTASAG